MGIIKQIQFISLIALVFCNLESIAQEQKKTVSAKQMATLDDIITIAGKKSLDAFKAKQQYGASYWQFKSFKASVLPKIELDLQPLTYNKSIIKRYDSDANIDVYRPQQNLNSYGNLSLTQNVRATGARFYVNSNFSRLSNFGLVDSKYFTTTPFSIGLYQPIMAFNSLKWMNKIAPLQFENAKKEYLYELQNIKLKAVNYFFNWALANKKVELANENVITIQKLFKIGKKRFELGSIEKDDILNLELDIYNSEINLTMNERELEKAESELRLFLRNDSPLNLWPELPELISNLQIDPVEAVILAETNNPEIFNLKIKKIEAERDLEKVIKETRFDLSLSGSYGFNKNSNMFNEAYSQLLEQRMVAIKLNIPLLDWGERRGNIKTAKMNNEVSEIAIQQEGDKLKQQLNLKIIDFNLQKQLVEIALRTSEISKSSYDVTEKRFLSGTVDLLRLMSARNAWQKASENYITSLYNYWRFYYEVEQLTLYDFHSKSTISANFDEILDK